MELKPYQQKVIQDITRFLELVQSRKDLSKAFMEFWVDHPETPLSPFAGGDVEPYQENVSGVPHICIKVPTAGGKTFIACNAIKTIFDAFDFDRPKAVVWLVPSITILEQTKKNLGNPDHPYRQKINSHFGNKVEVYDKEALLQGSNFNSTTIKEQLNIMIFSFDSFRANNPDLRKVFQENGNLQSFENTLGRDDEITLGKIISFLNPVVVVDESHNAVTPLSVAMLQKINPSFILDLTATPRDNSNIISFVDALELKRENMVKLPVIVYNHQEKAEVINSALHLQKRLEMLAAEEETKGGKHIRPIVLFQAQPKNGADNTTFELLKKKLVELKIPEEQIKIKTANNNELKDIDLLSKDCPVRYIITINALKEGWDCPFAYILASLADKNSPIEVEQILGRVLRQPYVMQHRSSLLNLCYVLTASSKFRDTLDLIVTALNKAGFSDRDCKSFSNNVENNTLDDSGGQNDSRIPETVIKNGQSNQETLADIDLSKITLLSEAEQSSQIVAQMEKTAIAKNHEYENTACNLESMDATHVPAALRQMVKTYSIKTTLRDAAKKISIPQFFLHPVDSIFEKGELDNLLSKESLLDGFPLSMCDTNINFNAISTELYRVDLDVTRKDHTPTFIRIDGKSRTNILAYILDSSRQDHRIKNFIHRIMSVMGNISPIPDKEIEKFVARILESFTTEEQFKDFANNEYTYIAKIKEKIAALAENFAEEMFKKLLDTDKIFLKPSFSFPEKITPGKITELSKSLYEYEGDMNGFERDVITKIASLENIKFWTRNIERKGFKINGFINHFPDFIIQTNSGKTIVLETKGDHLDAEQKLRLGNIWASKAGGGFKYFMVYNTRTVENAYTLDKFLEIMRQL